MNKSIMQQCRRRQFRRVFHHHHTNSGSSSFIRTGNYNLTNNNDCEQRLRRLQRILHSWRPVACAGLHRGCEQPTSLAGTPLHPYHHHHQHILTTGSCGTFSLFCRRSLSSTTTTTDNNSATRSGQSTSSSTCRVVEPFVVVVQRGGANHTEQQDDDGLALDNDRSSLNVLLHRLKRILYMDSTAATATTTASGSASDVDVDVDGGGAGAMMDQLMLLLRQRLLVFRPVHGGSDSSNSSSNSLNSPTVGSTSSSDELTTSCPDISSSVPVPTFFEHRLLPIVSKAQAEIMLLLLLNRRAAAHNNKKSSSTTTTIAIKRIKKAKIALQKEIGGRGDAAPSPHRHRALLQMSLCELMLYETALYGSCCNINLTQTLKNSTAAAGAAMASVGDATATATATATSTTAAAAPANALRFIGAATHVIQALESEYALLSLQLVRGSKAHHHSHHSKKAPVATATPTSAAATDKAADTDPDTNDANATDTTNGMTEEVRFLLSMTQQSVVAYYRAAFTAMASWGLPVMAFDRVWGTFEASNIININRNKTTNSDTNANTNNDTQNNDVIDVMMKTQTRLALQEALGAALSWAVKENDVRRALQVWKCVKKHHSELLVCVQQQSQPLDRKYTTTSNQLSHLQYLQYLHVAHHAHLLQLAHRTNDYAGLGVAALRSLRKAVAGYDRAEKKEEQEKRKQREYQPQQHQQSQPLQLPAALLSTMPWSTLLAIAEPLDTPSLMRLVHAKGAAAAEAEAQADADVDGNGGAATRRRGGGGRGGTGGGGGGEGGNCGRTGDNGTTATTNNIPASVWLSVLHRLTRDHCVADADAVFRHIVHQLANDLVDVGVVADEAADDEAADDDQQQQPSHLNGHTQPQQQKSIHIRGEAVLCMMKLYAVVKDFDACSSVFLHHVVTPQLAHYKYLLRATTTRDERHQVFLESMADDSAGAAGGSGSMNEAYSSSKKKVQWDQEAYALLYTGEYAGADTGTGDAGGFTSTATSSSSSGGEVFIPSDPEEDRRRALVEARRASRRTI